MNQLEEPYGNSSPMGLLWMFMGYSKPYAVFTGVVEIIAGGLVLFRRTTLLGALLAMAVMTNVVMLNFCYDVPVKIFSTHLLGIALFIAWPGIKVVIDFFFKQLPAPRIKLPIVKPVFIAGILAIMIVNEINELDDGKENPLNGVYVSKTSNGWNKMILENDYVEVSVGDSLAYFELSVDTAHKIIRLVSYADSTQKYAFSYQFLPGNYFSPMP